jgi:UDP-GlcNAc:undecaprenyl-phosphate GlcNAc-1-phosphate transferase
MRLHLGRTAMTDLIFFLEAFCFSYLFTGAILRFSIRRRLLDIPNDRSSHSVPKPRLGGVAITLAFYLTSATLLLVGFRPFSSSTILAGAFGGGAVIALAGLVDDLRGLDAKFKLLVQFAAAGIAVASGVVLREFRIPLIGTLSFGPLAAPVTLLWIVAIVNFYNFVDGIDGLAGGIGVIASSFLFFIGGMTAAIGMRSLYAVLAGSLLGFLRFNFPPSRIFMGDMGSTFIGFTFAVLSVVGEGLGVPAFITILLLAGVICDVALTLIRRAIKGEKVFSPHRAHYYQRLTSLGLSHKQVTLLEYLVAVLLGVSALLAFHKESSFVTFLSVVWIGFFLWALAKIRSMEKGKRLLWEGRTIGVAFGDLAFVSLSYVLSYYLRLNFKFPEAETASMLISLPIVLVIRTGVFYTYGLYRGVWRYTTFDDVIRIGKAVTVGSAVMVVSFTLLFRFKSFPRSVFMIDWFILTVFMAGSRIATRWFHELPAREEIPGRRVIIAGTGAVAELILQHVKKAGGLRAIGYVDDRAGMTGHIIHGLKVLGPLAKVAEIAEKHGADEVIAMSSFFERIPMDSRDRLGRAGIRLRPVADPSEISARRVDPRAAPPCGVREALVAGNGPFLQAAEIVLSRASRLVLVSDDARAMERTGAPDERAAKTTRYLGILNDRSALRRVFETTGPELVFADFIAPDSSIENTGEAFVRTVLMPLEKIASEVARRPGTRLFVIERAAESTARQWMLAGELLAFDLFRENRGRLLFLRIGVEPSLEEWCRISATAVAGTGGLYRVVPGSSEEGAPELVQIPAAGLAPDPASPLRSLARGLEEGDIPLAIEALRHLSPRSPMAEKVS